MSRSNLLIASRRMCYKGREMLVAVHLVDSVPIPLFGRIFSCDYEGDGLYIADIDLLPVPEKDEFRNWIIAKH